MIVLDDYGHLAYRAQHDMWGAFGTRVGSPVLTLPTGQGLMIR